VTTVAAGATGVGVGVGAGVGCGVCGVGGVGVGVGAGVGGLGGVTGLAVTALPQAARIANWNLPSTVDTNAGNESCLNDTLGVRL